MRKQRKRKERMKEEEGVVRDPESQGRRGAGTGDRARKAKTGTCAPDQGGVRK